MLFGAEQVVYSGFLELFRSQQLPAEAAMRAVRVNKNRKVVGRAGKRQATHHKAP